MNLEQYLNLNLTLPSDVNYVVLNRYLSGTPMASLGLAFMEAERNYSVNAQYLCGHAVHESDWGTSRIARNKNNLFGYGAKDSDPYNSAYTFDSFEECIDYVAERISKNYLKPAGKYYNGPTLVGMNKRYASDTNWARKIAGYMMKIEGVLNKMPNDYQGHWAEAAIEIVKKENLMFGYPDGSFKPDRAITRAEVASVLAQLLGKFKQE